MELRQLRYFIAVAERLSFSKAAGHLHVTVPPLSRQIRQLEEELDAQLFVRDRRHVVLTDAGQLLLREARVLVAQTSRACDSVRLATRGEAGVVKIAVGLGLGEKISRVLVEHAGRFPAVEVSCSAIYSIFQCDALLQGTIDVGFLRSPIDCAELTSEMLFGERFVIHASKDSPLAKLKTVRVRDLAGESLLVPHCKPPISIYDTTIELCAKAGVPIKIIRVSTDPLPHGDIQTILLASRKGICIMPDEPACSPAAGSEVVAIPFDEPDARVEVHAAWRKEEKSPAVLAFLDSVRRVFQLPTAAASPCPERRLDPRVTFRLPKPGSYQTS
ncbi:MAG TPA: LysR substrate-binding domain-containing protein [Candidatus Acidoferrales bacterium]|jgi:DNA-binding transcriptional LysR family regulator|nr:LysR substrate-binding domain-containing protein [Candidatus Acidoferrales bacterium]